MPPPSMWHYIITSGMYDILGWAWASACAKHGVVACTWHVIRMWLSIKPQATVYEPKSTDMHNTESGSGMVQQACHARCVWLLHAHGSSTPCALQDVSTLRWHSCYLLWHAIALIVVAIGEVGPCDEWLPLWVAMQIMALTDETFLPWGSPYCSSHWRGRSTSGSRTCYCQ